jgi:hypothetical protein
MGHGVDGAGSIVGSVQCFCSPQRPDRLGGSISYPVVTGGKVAGDVMLTT